MAFESRHSGSQYMYVGVRDPATGKVRKLYLGRGERALAAAQAIAGRRNRRDAERRTVAEAQAAVRELDAQTAELDRAADMLTEVVLLLAGWHRPNYGPWRRRRHGHGGHGDGLADGRDG